MRPKKRYRLIVEQYDENRNLERRMEESRFKLDSDYADGEATVGLLLSFVPKWAAAFAAGGDGLATICHMVRCLDCNVDSNEYLFRQLGLAYERWGATHDFRDSVKVVIDDASLECNAMECDCNVEATDAK